MNRLLDQFGYRIVRTTRGTEPPDYEENFVQLKNNPGGFEIVREPRFLDARHHPEGYVDHECAFASRHINRIQPKRLLDLGSYRHFIIGLLAHCQVTAVDVRSRKPASNNEVVSTSDVKKLDSHDNVFDVVVSLCVLEHFGLTRYGDEFDREADRKVMNEMIRV